MHRAIAVVAAAAVSLTTVATTTASGTPASNSSASGHPAAVKHSQPPVGRLRGRHDARQIIAITSSRRSVTHATVRAFARTGHGWQLVHGPWSAWIGRSGFAAPGHKREGDGRTPSGSYRISYFFGAGPRPTVRFRWRHARSTSFWDDDSTSRHYNQWVDSRHAWPGRDPEPLQVSPSYDAAAVIAYNTARTPYRGSGIFLHITHHSATSGCVALPRHRLLALFRWLRPADRPRMIMGATGDVTS